MLHRAVLLCCKLGLFQCYLYITIQLNLMCSEKCLFFPKRTQIILCKPHSNPIWIAWLGFYSNASSAEASRCARIIGPGIWLNATGRLPASLFRTRVRSSTDGPDHIVQNQPGTDWVPADWVKIWPNGSGPECKNHPAQKANVSEPIRIGCESDLACLLGR